MPPSRGAPPSLLSAILADCTRAGREQGRPAVTATLDASLEHDHTLPGDPALVRRVLEPLIRRAFESATQTDHRRDGPLLREVVVTSVDLGDAIEIEVADSGPALSARVRHWLADTVRSTSTPDAPPEEAGFALAAVRAAATRIAGSLHAANCPDGGVAITLRLTRPRARRLAA